MIHEASYPQPRAPSQLYWDPEVATMPPKSLRALQHERLAPS